MSTGLQYTLVLTPALLSSETAVTKQPNAEMKVSYLCVVLRKIQQ